MKETATTTLQFKATIKGCLEFGNQKSYDMMIAHYQKRLESYYKNDILLKNPSYFSTDTLSLDVPRTTVNCMEKTWKNTAALLRELKGYSVAGMIYIWVTDLNNKLIFEEVIEPQGDKAATMEYSRGVSLLKKRNNEEAIEAFTKAIEKYSQYAQAYERRGYAYFNLGRYEDALIDFGKSLSIRPTSEAYLGQGEAQRALGDLEDAIETLQRAIDNAVPFQPIFWASRRVKGECHAELNQFEKACFELKLVTKRVFKQTDPNFNHRKQAWQVYGEVLLKSGNRVEAANAFKEALTIESCAHVEELLRSVNHEVETVKRGTLVAAN